MGKRTVRQYCNTEDCPGSISSFNIFAFIIILSDVELHIYSNFIPFFVQDVKICGVARTVKFGLAIASGIDGCKNLVRKHVVYASEQKRRKLRKFAINVLKLFHAHAETTSNVCEGHN